MWKALVDTSTILNIHLGSSGQLAVTAPDAPMDVMITLQPINICMAAADLVWSRVFKEYRESAGRVRPRAARAGSRTSSTGSTARTTCITCGPSRTSVTERPSRRLPAPHPHRASSPIPIGVEAPRRHRHRQHVLGAGLSALRLVVAERARGARTVWRVDDGVHRRRVEQDHARERDALVPLRPVRPPRRRRQCTVGALRAEVAGHDVSDPFDGQGPAGRTHR